MKTLLDRPTGTDYNQLKDLIACLAANFEDSLIENGAIPGKDYSRLDLYKLAQPFALHMFKSEQLGISFVNRWLPGDDGRDA